MLSFCSGLHIEDIPQFDDKRQKVHSSSPCGLSMVPISGLPVPLFQCTAVSPYRQEVPTAAAMTRFMTNSTTCIFSAPEKYSSMRKNHGANMGEGRPPFLL